MKAVAVLCVRNEEHCIGTTLRHLIDQGLKVAVIDNESTDATSAIVSGFSTKDVIYRGHLRYQGVFCLTRILEVGASVAREIGADWLLAQGADEILQSPYPGESLYESLKRIDGTDANVVNFHEFVFIPTDPSQDYRGRDYVREMLSYYFYQPTYPWQARLGRAALSSAYVAGAGHFARGADIRRHPDDFVLRHYIALSFQAFKQKYQNRRFAPEDLAKGWHKDRASIDMERIVLPPPDTLKRLDKWDSCRFDTSDPWAQHFWQRPDVTRAGG